MLTPRLVNDIFPGSFSSVPRNLTAFENTLFFSADDGVSGYELWKSDGTSAGTVGVADINPGIVGSVPAFLTAAGETLFFSANDGVSRYELWKSDGTAAGTALVADIRSGSNSSSPRYITAVGNTVFFNARGDGIGGELWKSDGTAAGTVLVADINPGTDSSFPRSITAAGNTLFFSANKDFSTGANGIELFKSDGTATGTVQVADIVPGDLPSYPSNITAVGNTVFFSTSQFDRTSGAELWKSDGTAAGTVLVSDINPGFRNSNPTELTAVGNSIFFSANDGVNGYELWKSDGTAAGTVLAVDINPESASSFPQALTLVGDSVYFFADDGNGLDLWKSDGTAAGTVQIADLSQFSSLGSGSPLTLELVDNTLFFSADDGNIGNELWAIDLEEEEPDRYVAFSGGGWNTHSLLAGFFAGALDTLEVKGVQPTEALGELMEDVKGIGAISGGSWFLSHLAYSEKFLNSFDTRADRDKYNSTGYNGQIARLVNRASSKKLSRELKETLRDIVKFDQLGLVRSLTEDTIDLLEFLAKATSFFGDGELDWRSLVEGLVYGPFGMNTELANVQLDETRQSWAREKDLIIAIGLSTSDTVLRKSSAGDPVFPQAEDRVFGRAEPTLPGAQGRPLGLLSTVSEQGAIEAYADNPADGPLRLSYSNDNSLGFPAPAGRTISNQRIPLSPDLSVIDATVASSSALAALAQPATFPSLLPDLVTNRLATTLRLLSPLASFGSSANGLFDIPTTTEDQPDFNSQFEKSVNDAEVRLMDGGYLDNAPAAYTLRQIQQDQGLTKSFDLTLFFNSSIDPITGVRMNVAETGDALSSFRLPNDLAQLFGRTTGERPAPAGTLVDGPFPGLNNRMPSAQIFEEDAWRGETEPEWQFSRDSVTIGYFDLNVTTVANSEFGIQGGQSGRVRLFVSNNSQSNAAPLKRVFLDEYRQNYDFARRAIRDSGGADFMLNALGFLESQTEAAMMPLI